MTRVQFKSHFVATFLANWVSQHYDRCCQSGDHSLLEHPPVADAEFLAEEAWAELTLVNFVVDDRMEFPRAE